MSEHKPMPIDRMLAFSGLGLGIALIVAALTAPAYAGFRGYFGSLSAIGLVLAFLLIFAGGIVAQVRGHRLNRLRKGKCPGCGHSLLGYRKPRCHRCHRSLRDDEVAIIWSGHSARTFAACVWSFKRGAKRAAAMWWGRCPKCRYPLGGLASPMCPECGEPFDEQDVEFAWAGYQSRNPAAVEPAAAVDREAASPDGNPG